MPPEPETSRAYTKISLNDVEDAAVLNGLGHRWEARVAREPLGAEETGLTHFQLRPGQRSPGPHHPSDGEPVDDPWVN